MPQAGGDVEKPKYNSVIDEEKAKREESGEAPQSAGSVVPAA